MMEKICPECGGRFIGREDKIYCCDSCRANHNNRIYRKDKLNLKRINAILTTNRKLLEAEVMEGHTSISLRYLERNGFNPEFWTSTRKRPLRPTQYFCYDFSYYLLPLHLVNIKQIDVAKYADLQYLRNKLTVSSK